jgi:flagellar basal body-associated protein FliL
MFETNKEKKNENNKEKEKDKPAYIFILVFVMILFLVVIGFFFLRKSDSSKLMFNQATANVQSAATAATVSDMVDI